MNFVRLIFAALMVPLASLAVEIPQTAKPLYQVTSSGSKANLMFKDIQTEESKFDIELKCKTLYYRWEAASETHCSVGNGWGSGTLACLNPFKQAFGSTRFVSSNRITMTASF